MNNIKVTVENGGEIAVYEGEFAIIGIVRDDDEEKGVTIIPTGVTTAYSAAMLGCQVAAKIARAFDTIERINAGDEVHDADR